MKKIALIIAAALAGSFAAGYYLPQPKSGDTPALDNPPLQNNAELAAIAERVDSLEQMLLQERQARQLLQEELLYLTNEFDAVRGSAGRGPVRADATSPGQDEVARSRETARQRYASRNSAEQRTQLLIDGGFSPERAATIVQREAKLRMDILEARYEAQRSGDFTAFEQVRNQQTNLFRDELGPVEYERYLEANDRPTSVVIGNVIDTSPAQRVGLQPGDSIVRYDGTRVYNYGDLTRATLAGEGGDTVVVDVIRDGAPMQVTVPRGPLGVTGRFARR